MRFNREIGQLSDSIATMQHGLQQLVTQVSHATATMVENIDSLAQGNQKLYQQSARRAKELEDDGAYCGAGKPRGREYRLCQTRQLPGR